MIGRPKQRCEPHLILPICSWPDTWRRTETTGQRNFQANMRTRSLKSWPCFYYMCLTSEEIMNVLSTRVLNKPPLFPQLQLSATKRRGKRTERQQLLSLAVFVHTLHLSCSTASSLPLSACRFLLTRRVVSRRPILVDVTHCLQRCSDTARRQSPLPPPPKARSEFAISSLEKVPRVYQEYISLI